MAFRFERLQVWQDSRKFIVFIYKLTFDFPKTEIYALVDQLRRAAVSIALNIAEGSDRKSEKEFIRYLRVSIGSVEEVVTGLFIAKDLGYITNEEFDEAYKFSETLVSKIVALVNSIKKQ